MWILEYRKSNARRKVCMELLKVSGGGVLASVLDKRIYFAGDLGSKTGMPGLRKRLVATLIGTRV